MDDELTEDTLFLALTRPTLFFGIPFEAALVLLTIGMLSMIWTGNPILAICIGAALYFAARLITRRDYNQFRILALYLRTSFPNQNRKYWGGSSYGPLATPLMKRRGFANV